MNNKTSTRRDFFRKPIQGFLSALNNENPDQTSAEDTNKPFDINHNNAILNDFNIEQLKYEMMKLSVDPANLDEKQMKKILLDHMEKERMNLLAI